MLCTGDPDGGDGAGRQRHRQGQVHRVAAVAMGWCGFGQPPAGSVAMATTWPPRTVIRKSGGCAPWNPRCTAAVWDRWPAWTRWAAAPAPARWWWRPACLSPNRLESLAALDDSKKLTEKARERLFPLICRYALAYHVVFIPSVEVDRRGVHVANIEGMRRAVAGPADTTRICAERRLPGARDCRCRRCR